MNLGKPFKQIRKKRNWTQAALCRRSKVRQVQISEIENINNIKIGDKLPKVGTLLKLSEAMEVPLGVLMWLALDENDVTESKRKAFKELKKPLDALILEFFGDELEKKIK